MRTKRRRFEIKKEVMNGQESCMEFVAMPTAREFVFTEAGVARVRAAIQTWDGYGTAADRRWREPRSMPCSRRPLWRGDANWIHHSSAASGGALSCLRSSCKSIRWRSEKPMRRSSSHNREVMASSPSPPSATVRRSKNSFNRVFHLHRAMLELRRTICAKAEVAA
jgi:hypothetical protein